MFLTFAEHQGSAKQVLKILSQREFQGSAKQVLMIRTTITLDEDTFKEAKKYAIDKRSAFGDIVRQALKNYLQGRKRSPIQKFDLRIYKMGKVKGNLSRSEIIN